LQYGGKEAPSHFCWIGAGNGSASLLEEKGFNNSSTWTAGRTSLCWKGARKKKRELFSAKGIVLFCDIEERGKLELPHRGTIYYRLAIISSGDRLLCLIHRGREVIQAHQLRRLSRLRRALESGAGEKKKRQIPSKSVLMGGKEKWNHIYEFDNARKKTVFPRSTSWERGRAQVSARRIRAPKTMSSRKEGVPAFLRARKLERIATRRYNSQGERERPL